MLGVRAPSVPMPSVRTLPLLAVLVLAGCDARPALPGPEELIDPCGAVLRVISVSIKDTDGTPATSLRSQSVVVATGEVLASSSGNEEGVYAIANDSHRDRFAEGSRIVRFTAVNESRRADADFVIEDDGCHVRKVSGPAQITARLTL